LYIDWKGLIGSLDLRDFSQLTRLDCYNNQLTSLDVSTNTQLTWLYCYDNQLTSLDVSTNTQLISLDCYDNQLTDFSFLLQLNTERLEYLRLDENSLTEIRFFLEEDNQRRQIQLLKRYQREKSLFLEYQVQN
jgi:Leucine-rich repeat (LRR) protein